MSYKSDLKKFNRQLEDALELATSAKVRNKLTQDIADQIRERTRQGYGVNKAGANKTKLKALKKSTIESRKSKQRRGLLSDKTSPGKSNATETAQMLDALKGRAINKLLVLEFIGKRRGSALTNAEVAAYYDEERRFFNVSSEDIKVLVETIDQALDDAVRKLFKK